jgi:hypothetical protein
LDVAAEKHFDVERGGHQHEVDIQTFLLEKSSLLGYREREHGYRQRWDANLDVFGAGGLQDDGDA